jgi:uncharacterized phage-associated protein
MHDSRAVANEILRIAAAENIRVSPMQLLKLVFFAHGWSWGLLGKPLIRHEAYAWQYGPVVREVYWAFNRFGRHPIHQEATDENGVPFAAQFTSEERQLMASIVRGYGKFHAFKLSDISHRHGTPWQQAYRSGARVRIDPTQIKTYYEGLARRRDENRHQAL